MTNNTNQPKEKHLWKCANCSTIYRKVDDQIKYIIDEKMICKDCAPQFED